MLDGEGVDATLKSPEPLDGRQIKNFQTNLAPNDAQLLPLLRQKGVRITVKSLGDHTSKLGEIPASDLPAAQPSETPFWVKPGAQMPMSSNVNISPAWGRTVVHA